jgi:hypothetical protein
MMTGTIAVAQNLHSALLRLRKKEIVRTLWVDAICINQNDNLERSKQVRQMPDVYQTAFRTLVWLGPGNSQTRRAFELVPYLLDASAAFNEHDAFVFSPHLNRRLTRPNFGVLQKHKHLYEAFRQLDRLPYFSRLWVVQELAISGEKAHFFCGPDEISFTSLFIASLTFNRLSLGERAPLKPWGSFLQIAQTSLQRKLGETPSLLSLLEEYREKQCNDHRDKLFGLLGLATDDQAVSLGILINYQQTTTEAYAEFAKAVIERDNDFNIFRCLAFPSSHKDLPTWAPDWSTEGIQSRPLIRFTEANKYAAGGCASPNIIFSSSRKEIITNGIILFQITKTGIVVGPHSKGKILQDWEAIFSQVSHDDCTYVSGGSTTDAFIATVLMGHQNMSNYIAKQQFLLWYKNIKTTHHNAFSSTTGILDTVADAQIQWQDDNSEDEDKLKEMFLSCFASIEGRKFCVTERNYFAIVPGHAKEGDHIAIFEGSTYPIVLRESGHAWTIVGECYVHGAMHGELYERTECNKLIII